MTPSAGVIRAIGNAPILRLIKSPKITTFEDLVPERREFLWPPYIPRGGLGVTAGLGSAGKTTLATAMCAWASTGNWPHAAPTDPTKCLIIEFQDDDANEIKPKLEANGYDPKNVLRLTTKKCPSYEELESLILQHDLGMVLISPGRRYVMKYVKNENNNAEVEPVLDRLHDLGKRTKCFIDLIKHFNKKEEASSNARVSNAAAWVDSSRTTIIVAKKGDDDEFRVVESTKYNESQKMKFEMTFTDVGEDAGPDNPTAYVRVTLNRTETGVDAVLSQKGLTQQQREVVAFFDEHLGEFHYREVAEVLGRAPDTMKTQLNRMANAKQPLVLRGSEQGTFRGR